jgi:hypothetical protein
MDKMILMFGLSGANTIYIYLSIYVCVCVCVKCRHVLKSHRYRYMSRTYLGWVDSRIPASEDSTGVMPTPVIYISIY